VENLIITKRCLSQRLTVCLGDRITDYVFQRSSSMQRQQELPLAVYIVQLLLVITK